MYVYIRADWYRVKCTSYQRLILSCVYVGYLCVICGDCDKEHENVISLLHLCHFHPLTRHLLPFLKCASPIWNNHCYYISYWSGQTLVTVSLCIYASILLIVDKHRIHAFHKFFSQWNILNIKCTNRICTRFEFFNWFAWYINFCRISLW